ncbi:MAG: MBOAT family protein [Gammaproteobacteria bacterium]|nr:MAG: MBOAT family protein [Gammaproteobacteria bacterium]
MLFSYPTFLFGFLPIILTLYFLSPWKAKNAILLTASLFFYAWGESFYVLVMIISILSNHTFGVRIGRLSSELPNESKKRKILLAYGVAVNLLLLGWFKYANFLFENINVALNWIDVAPIIIKEVHLPLGISFFTFQAISYLVDVYRNITPAQPSRYKLGLYISLFPQLIAGPIVRYHDVAGQIEKRTHTIELFSSGVQRFVFGLAKKMLIANPLGLVADSVFAQSASDLSSPVAWLGIISYSLQIYFDFSGYSDMAIGLGRMFGFRFLENFNYPYISKSIQEFWTRWHISLSTWFRDYLYFPLGGSRCSPTRTYINLIIVFFLCGFWHGASWNFIVWGLIHGFFLIVERAWIGKHLAKAWAPFRYFYAIFVVTIAWVFFRADTLPDALAYLSVMFGLSGDAAPIYSVPYMLTNEAAVALIFGIVFATPLYPTITRKLSRHKYSNSISAISQKVIPEIALVSLLLALGLSSVATSTYNPFIYFRF